MSSSLYAKLPEEPIKFATFNVSMESRNYIDERTDNNEKNKENGDSSKKHLSSRRLEEALSSGHHPQINNIAEIIQRVRPDILLLNEFDYIEHIDYGINAFQKNYLSKPQNGAEPIHYSHLFVAPVNTGVLSGMDIDADGTVARPHDAYGFGFYPGHYGMVLLSRFPIDKKNVRTFQKFLWSDMPNALRPLLDDGTSYYSDSVWKSLRLSSKSHWDIPITINGKVVHVLASHPTPPVFDGPENRNGKRNHDEIRFWRDYINKDNNVYIYDDTGKKGGLRGKQRFVIMGDLNASPVEGDGIRSGIKALVEHEHVASKKAPSSLGGKQNKPTSAYAASHTAQWGMRADYVLASEFGIAIKNQGVFWPQSGSELFRLVKDRKSSSDHRLVWVNVSLVD